MQMPNFLRPLFSAGEAKPEGNSYVREDYLLQEVRDLRDTVLRLRQDHEKQWLQAWEFFKGHHWVTWREDRWVESEATDRPKLVVNYVQQVVLTRLGHLIKNRPMLTGVPGTADENARNAAKAAVKVLEAYHHKLRLAKKYRRAIFHMLVTGKSYLKTGWDPYAGKIVKLPDPKRRGAFIEVPEGDLVVDLVRAHELLPEPGTADLEETQRAIYRTFLPLPAIRRRWGSELTKDLQPIDPSSREGSGLLRSLYGFDSAVPASVNDRVEVLEVYYRRGVSRAEGGQYEGGLRAIFAGDKLMQATPTPKGFAEIPLVEFSEIETDSIYSTSTARGLIDLNKIVDVELSYQEHSRKVHRPKTLIPYQANIEEGAWDKTDDEVVNFFYPYKPEGYEPPGLPPHHIESRNAHIGMIKEIGGNFDIMSGKAQSDVRSGRMVAYLQEFAGTVLGVPSANMADGFEELGNQMLHILQEYARETRIESYTGRNRRMEVVSFKGADLELCSGVRVEPDSAIPTSRAEKYDRIERWAEKQLIPPDKAVRMLNIVNPEQDLWGEDELDRQIADEACYKLSRASEEDLAEAQRKAEAIAAERNAGRAAKGMMQVPTNERDLLRALKVEAFDFENHAAIIDQVNKAYRKTQLYRDSSPALRSLVDAYVDWHIMWERGFDLDNPEAMAAIKAAQAAGAAAAEPGAAPAGEPGAPSAGGPPAPGPAPSPKEAGPEEKAGLPPVRPAPTPMHR